MFFTIVQQQNKNNMNNKNNITKKTFQKTFQKKQPAVAVAPLVFSALDTYNDSHDKPVTDFITSMTRMAAKSVRLIFK